MRFKVTVQNGKDGSLHEHTIEAKDLDDAEAVANKKFEKTRLHWVDIRYADIKNARKAHGDS